MGDMGYSSARERNAIIWIESKIIYLSEVDETSDISRSEVWHIDNPPVSRDTIQRATYYEL